MPKERLFSFTHLGQQFVIDKVLDAHSFVTFITENALGSRLVSLPGYILNREFRFDGIPSNDSDIRYLAAETVGNILLNSIVDEWHSDKEHRTPRADKMYAYLRGEYVPPIDNDVTRKLKQRSAYWASVLSSVDSPSGMTVITRRT